MKTALFDLDGTLIDSRGDLAKAVNLTRQDFDLPPRPVAEVVACVGEGVRVLIERAIPELPMHWDAMLVRQQVHYQQHCLDQTSLYEGVAESLNTLHADGWRLAVITNKPACFTHTILEGLGLTGLFQAVVGGGECDRLKPDPAPLYLAARRMDCVLTEADWMIGDHFTDLAAGRSAGIKSCFCRYGFGEVRHERYDAAIDCMCDLLPILH